MQLVKIVEKILHNSVANMTQRIRESGNVCMYYDGTFFQSSNEKGVFFFYFVIATSKYIGMCTI